MKTLALLSVLVATSLPAQNAQISGMVRNELFQAGGPRSV